MYSGPKPLPLSLELVERGRKRRVALREEQQAQASRREALERQIRLHEARLEDLQRCQQRPPGLGPGPQAEQAVLREGLAALRAELQRCAGPAAAGRPLRPQEL
eukprot:EG_transcript_58277